MSVQTRMILLAAAFWFAAFAFVTSGAKTASFCPAPLGIAAGAELSLTAVESRRGCGITTDVDTAP